MRKKASLEMRYLVLIILALLVIVVISLIFTNGIGDFMNKLKELAQILWGEKPDLTAITKTS